MVKRRNAFFKRGSMYIQETALSGHRTVSCSLSLSTLHLATIMKAKLAGLMLERHCLQTGTLVHPYVLMAKVLDIRSIVK